MTAAEVCSRLRISKRSLQRLNNDRVLTYHRIGNRFLYPSKSVEAYFESVEVVGSF